MQNVTECSLSTCLMDYDISVMNGRASIQTSNVDFGTTFYPIPPSPANFKKFRGCWKPGGAPNDMAFDHSISGNPNNFNETGFTCCNHNMETFSNYAYDTLAASVLDQYSPGTDENTWVGPIWSELSVANTGTYKRIANVGFERTLSNMAASLTKLGLDKSNSGVKGIMFRDEVFVSVQWPWLILPALLVIIGTIFLTVTIVASKKGNTPLWKSSVLALLYHGLDGMETADYMTGREMEKTAEETDVQLQYSECDNRLMLRRRGVADIQ